MLGTWKPQHEDLPWLTISPLGEARLHTPGMPQDDLRGVWRIEDDHFLVLSLHIPPNPSDPVEILRDRVQETLRFKITERGETSMTLENEDGSIHVRYDRLADEA